MKKESADQLQAYKDRVAAKEKAAKVKEDNTQKQKIEAVKDIDSPEEI